MNYIWNESDIQQPPLIVLPVKHTKLNITNITNVLNSANSFYENQKDFNEAAALCSKLIARRKNSFKKMSGFKSMCKLNSALCRLLRVNIKEILNNFRSILPEYISKVTETYLPSRSCLEYILIRLISIYKIYERIENCARLASMYFLRLLNQNFFQEIITVFLAVLSQIWKLSQRNLIKTALYYEELLKFRFDLPESQKPWLKNEIEFPKKIDVIQSLDRKDIDNDNDYKHNFEIRSENLLEPLSSFTQNSGKQITKEFDKLNQEIDTGIIISRDSLLKASNKSRNTDILQIENINTIDEIRNFFTEEGKQRQKSLKQAITKNISNGEWITFKKSINNASSNKKKVIKLFKSFVRNKILK